MLSFIIPAYNEEALIEATVEQLHVAASALGCEYEIIVANDASTDETAKVAKVAGARVVDVDNRQIAATRNAGAASATGDVFIFVDADTLVPAATLRAAIRALDNGAIGGGATIKFRGRISIAGHFIAAIVQQLMHLSGMVGGCFMFMSRSAFEAVGGFDEAFFASEEVWLAKALRRRGRFVVLIQQVQTSGRKLRQNGVFQLLKGGAVIMLRGPAGVQKREGLDLWYDGQREARGHDD